jgi:hypothetical protein
MCETLHKASCFSTTNVTCLTKQPGLRPGLWPRLLKKLGVQTPQRDAGVPEDLTQVYVTDMKYFLTVGQWLQCILGPLGVMAGYEALGLNSGSSVLFGLFEMDMQLMGFAALVFVTFQVNIPFPSLHTIEQLLVDILRCVLGMRGRLGPATVSRAHLQRR